MAFGSFGNYRLHGHRHPTTPNEPNAMTVVYYLKNGSASSSAAAAPPQQGGRGGFGFAACVADGGDGQRPFITVADASGKVVCTLVTPSHAGMNQTVWGLTQYAPA